MGVKEWLVQLDSFGALSIKMKRAEIDHVEAGCTLSFCTRRVASKRLTCARSLSRSVALSRSLTLAHTLLSNSRGTGVAQRDTCGRQRWAQPAAVRLQIHEPAGSVQPESFLA